MTNSKITNLIASVSTERKVMGSSDINTRKTEDAQAFFAALMNQTGSNLPQSQKITQNQNVSQVTGADQKPKADYATKDAGRIKQAEKKEIISKDRIDGQAGNAGEEIKDAIKEEFDVTDEQIEEAMENLGMTMMDLLNPGSLAELAAELTGSDDVSSLLLSDAFTNIMQKITDIKQNLAETLGISMEELQAAMDELNLPEANPIAMEEMMEPGTLQETGVPNDEAVDNIAADDELMNSGKVVKNEASEQALNLREDQTIHAAVSAEESEQSGDETGSNAGSQNGQMTSGQQEKKESNTIFAETSISQNIRNNPLAEVNLQPEVPAYKPEINVADIMNQISEYTRISVSMDTTSIEMQLNPENLGKVFLHIATTKEGTITAQFAAQNEAVKEALEAQIVELKQNLNQQGLKVSAIEVTVSTHEFERNLEQNAEGERQQAQQREANRQGKRNLNLNNLHELSGLMSEEEMLAAKIMQENGNTMDVTA